MSRGYSGAHRGWRITNVPGHAARGSDRAWCTSGQQQRERTWSGHARHRRFHVQQRHFVAHQPYLTHQPQPGRHIGGPVSGLPEPGRPDRFLLQHQRLLLHHQHRAPGRLIGPPDRPRDRPRAVGPPADHHHGGLVRHSVNTGQNWGMVSEIFDPGRWHEVAGFSFTDITYHRAVDSGTVRVAFNRPEVRNAFRPHTVDELYRALDHARMTSDVGCVLLTGNGPSPKDGGWAFCSGGDQRIRGRDGYRYASGETAQTIDPARAGRLHIMEVHRLIRFMPKVVICVVPGWAAGGGHSLHVVCDLTLASREHARFKQTDADVGSFDGGFGSAYLARQVGQKFAREIFFLGESYDADAGHRMGTVNAVVPHADLERTALEWAAIINGKSPTSLRMLKFAFNLVDDGLVGQQVFSTEATRLAYMTDEAVEGRDAFLQKRAPDWAQFPWYY